MRAGRGEHQASVAFREHDVAANQFGHPDTVDVGNGTQVDNDLADVGVAKLAHPLLQLPE